MGSVEAALEAFAACKPDGYVLEERRIPELLPVIRSHMPSAGPKKKKELHELFAGSGAQPPRFLRLLKAHDGKVYFLHFWRAFGEAARTACDGEVDEGLVAELQALLDVVLRLLDDQAMDGKEVTVTIADLGKAVEAQGAVSQDPEFWRTCLQKLEYLADMRELRIEELTSVVLSWLHEAVARQEASQDAGPSESRPSPRADGSSEPPSADGDERGLPVRIHIYDVSQEDSIQRLNAVLANKWSPVKLGGVFHAGVEVNGLEWSYGFSGSDTVPGVSCVEPKENPQHRYRQTYKMRRTQSAPDEIAMLISDLIEEYPGDDYDLLKRNCCHFADEFTQRLGCGRIPKWIHRLARLGARVDGMLQTAQVLRAKMRGESLDDIEPIRF